MGLAERRVQQEYEKERIPKRLADFKAVCPNSQLTVKFDWDSFGDNKAAYDGIWGSWEQGFQALESVSADDLGKEAVTEKVKTLVVRNVPSTGEVKATFENGTLTIAMNFSEGNNGSLGYTAIQKVLEAGL